LRGRGWGGGVSRCCAKGHGKHKHLRAEKIGEGW
jgi:hypothetical protein